MLAGSGFNITGAASTVTRVNLPSNVVLVSNDRGKIAASSLTVDSIQGIINGETTYSKTEIDNMVYTQSVINALLTEKADTSHILRKKLSLQ